jgi:hypothetical protein
MKMNIAVPPSGDGGLPLSLSGNRVSRGTPARWTETTGWRDRDGLPIPDTLLVIGYTTVLRRWQNKKTFYITEHPLPDPDELNAAIPVAEWENGLDGKPSKPWKTTYVIYMVDVKMTGGLVHLRARHLRRQALLRAAGRSNRCDAHATRRACVSDRASRKASMEIGKIRDADAPASTADR